MNGVVVLSKESAQKPLAVGSLVTLELAVEEKIGQTGDEWQVLEPAGVTDWFPSGAFLLSAKSIRVLPNDGMLTKLSVEGVVRLPGAMKTARFRLKHVNSATEVDVSESTASEEMAKSLEKSEPPPPWLLPPAAIGGWNLWLLGFLGILLLIGLGYLVRYVLYRLALRSQAKWNHRDRAVRALQNLEKISRGKNQGQEQWKKFSFELAGILRKYSDENFHMDSRDMTDREFLAELRFHPKGTEFADLISHILSTITEVRYGTKVLESEMMPSLLKEARAYVDGTFVPTGDASQ